MKYSGSYFLPHLMVLHILSFTKKRACCQWINVESGGQAARVCACVLSVEVV